MKNKEKLRSLVYVGFDSIWDFNGSRLVAVFGSSVLFATKQIGSMQHDDDNDDYDLDKDDVPV